MIKDSSHGLLSQVGLSCLHQPFMRSALKRTCMYITFLIFFAFVVTSVLLRQQTSGMPFSVDKDVERDMVLIDQSKETPFRGGERNQQIEVADDIQSDRKKAMVGYEAGSNTKSTKDQEEPEVNNRGQAMKEVNPLKKELTNQSHAPEPTSRNLDQLMSNVELLRDAMISQSSMLIQPYETPSCVGDVKKEEVEDVLCIPRPRYLENVKNPCWYEKLANSASGRILRCLPYFHILGCAKSGTTDLWKRLVAHPHLITNTGLFGKEVLWWSWRKYGIWRSKDSKVPQGFRKYVYAFKNISRQIQSSLDVGNDNHTYLITGDGSPPDFWDFFGWPKISQNRGFKWPRVITPHLMKHFYDNPKFILLFRDPVDRVYSDYYFTHRGKPTPDDFHQNLIKSITILADCVKRQSVQGCFFNRSLHLQMRVRLTFACYSVYMREWLQQFSLDKFFFIKTEEYKANPEDTLRDVFKFLGLRPLTQTKIQEIVKKRKARVTTRKQNAGPMKPETKVILTKLLQSCGRELARLIKQPRFVWDS